MTRRQMTRIVLLLSVCCQNLFAQDSDSKTPQVETGKVQWNTDWQAATAASKSDGKPLFVQFQEIPGCETCQLYGRNVLSHPLLVEAIEDMFHPLLVYNNREGKDAKLLKQFNEPSWNNPVVRFLDADRKDLVPRKDRVWSAEQIAARMRMALEATGQSAPAYLALIGDDSNHLAKATFAMHCFWEGEAKLGNILGVHRTLAGWADGKEVVELHYDPDVVPYSRLVQSAKEMKCASTVYYHDESQQAAAKEIVSDGDVRPSKSPCEPAKPSDRKYYLRHSPHKYLPLTNGQQTKVNAALGSKSDWQNWLSPRQMTLLMKIRRALKVNPDAFADFAPYPDTGDSTDLAIYQGKLERHLDQSLTTTGQ